MQRVIESHLRSKDRYKWAGAMVMCESPMGACGIVGECSYDGDCFRSEHTDAMQAGRFIWMPRPSSAEENT